MDNNQMPSVEEVLNNGFEDASQDAGPDKKGPAIVGFVMGLLSVLCCFVPCFNVVLGLVGFILSIIGKKKTYMVALPIWGIVLSVLGVVLSIVSFIGFIAYMFVCYLYS